LDESTRTSVRVPQPNKVCLQRGERVLQAKYADVKGFNTVEIDNMIIGLSGDQEAVAYLVPFSVISGSRHLDLLADALQRTNEALSKMTGGWSLESEEDVDYVQTTVMAQTWLEEEFVSLETPKFFESIKLLNLTKIIKRVGGFHSESTLQTNKQINNPRQTTTVGYHLQSNQHPQSSETQGPRHQRRHIVDLLIIYYL
jgi:hypothetical protein